jgi:predicted O-methyltransferase YrrM
MNALIFHKTRRIHLFLFDLKQQQLTATENQYRQLEALIGLYQTLPLQQALPPLRGWTGSPDYLLALAQRTLEKTPNIAVECGSGSSSLVIGACLKKLGKGHCYSLDHNPEFAQKTRDALAAQSLTDYVTVVDAPLIPYQINAETLSWYKLDQLTAKNIELLNIDGPPMDTNPLARYPALPLLKDLIAPNCLVLLDDAARADEKAIVARWRTEFPNLQTTSISTEKGLTVFTMG